MAKRLCLAQCHHFGMGLAGSLGVTLPEYCALCTDDDAAHTRVGRGDEQRLLGQSQGLGHVQGVGSSEGHGWDYPFNDANIALPSCGRLSRRARQCWTSLGCHRGLKLARRWAGR